MDHTTEYVTAEELINRLTEIQDEYEVMDDFRQILRENTTPQQQNTGGKLLQGPNTADFSYQQHPSDHLTAEANTPTDNIDQ